MPPVAASALSRLAGDLIRGGDGQWMRVLRATTAVSKSYLRQSVMSL